MSQIYKERNDVVFCWIFLTIFNGIFFRFFSTFCVQSKIIFCIYHIFGSLDELCESIEKKILSTQLKFSCSNVNSIFLFIQSRYDKVEQFNSKCIQIHTLTELLNWIERCVLYDICQNVCATICIGWIRMVKLQSLLLTVLRNAR